MNNGLVNFILALYGFFVKLTVFYRIVNLFNLGAQLDARNLAFNQ
jgi:hypothetical protein